jgi:type I restriction enzyme, S subunit
VKTGWVINKLGAVTAKIGSGATPLGGEEAYKPTGISLIRSLNVYDDGFREAKLARIDYEQAERLSNVVVEPNDVLLNITGASVARCCIVPVELLPARVNQHVSIIRPIKQKLNSAFLHYLLISKTYKDRLLHTGEEGGSTRQAITKAQLQEFVIQYPESLHEQQRIVGILDEAFDGIATAKANAEKNLQNARALFESYLQSVFTHRGEGWVEKRLGEVAESVSTGPFGTMLHKSDYVPNGIPLVNPMNIVESRIIPSSKMMVNEETRERLRGYVLKAGDIVIGRRGELGRCALVTEREDGWLCGTGSFFVRLSDYMDGKFFVALFGSQQFKARLEESAVGTTMSSLNHSILNDLLLPIPPLAVQKEIMTKADKLLLETQRLESIYRRKLAAMDELKKSLLHQAFNGEL